jgi:hypothetical protein
VATNREKGSYSYAHFHPQFFFSTMTMHTVTVEQKSDSDTNLKGPGPSRSLAGPHCQWHPRAAGSQVHLPAAGPVHIQSKRVFFYPPRSCTVLPVLNSKKKKKERKKEKKNARIMV